MTCNTSAVAVCCSDVDFGQFGQQPRILHSDDRLVGEGAHQFDLPLGERLDPFPR